MGLLGEALAQWRGQALADVPGDWAARVRDSLDHERQDAFADRVRADLATDPGRDLASELTGWWTAHPENETFAELLMTAHAGAGRPAQARRVYKDTRRRLRETMDAEPCPALRDRNCSLFPVGRPAPPRRQRDEPSPPPPTGRGAATRRFVRPVVVAAGNQHWSYDRRERCPSTLSPSRRPGAAAACAATVTSPAGRTSGSGLEQTLENRPKHCSGWSPGCPADG
ncbi:AfsR/SARP family transcriptional regulator [Frankia sp. AgKG'84/4]|uniref:AfsR/SARP family transcriptional regulator n=1 Tax=Frankia sp. AgKG'84/4 TaxID=573490 RepID=UPI00200D3A8C|nr:BTAD domain-containing putative transcriptional regulator [Frankia sp. AgKG'84/4]MCL9793624.1 hypothetical protein [Frankia sp. AgKG'84/4]